MRFCLLEQFLPAGPNHPFAKQMIQHFNSLSTPLKSIDSYPELKNQEKRFTDREWRSATARSLWDLWSDPRFITARERTSLNSVEAFDEWEEFALFASHYFLLVASNTARGNTIENLMEATSLCSTDSFTCTATNGCASGVLDLAHIPQTETNADVLISVANRSIKSSRRFGVLYQSSDGNFCHHGGYGEQARLKSTNVYVANNSTFLHDPPPPSVLDARMCHTITSFPQKSGTGYTERLLVGGRSSPHHALGDCWFQRKHIWERVEDLPTPLYRHCATSVTDANGNKGVLIYGGRSNNGMVMNDWFLWRDVCGWTKLVCGENRLTPRFGAVVSSDAISSGLLIGGMAEDGTILPEIWRWSIDFTAENPGVKITAHVHESTALQQSICRFGACLSPSPTCLYLVGGISRAGILPDGYNVAEILSSDPFHIRPVRTQQDLVIQAPLLIGHSSIWDGDGLVTVGGGAVCFSFGNHSNTGVWKVLRGGRTIHNPWKLTDQQAQPDMKEPPQKRAKMAPKPKNGEVGSPLYDPNPSPVAREHVNMLSSFVRLMNKSEPAVMEGLELGSCTRSWTTEYLKRKIGRDREVCYSETSGSTWNVDNMHHR